MVDEDAGGPADPERSRDADVDDGDGPAALVRSRLADVPVPASRCGFSAAPQFPLSYCCQPPSCFL